MRGYLEPRNVYAVRRGNLEAPVSLSRSILVRKSHHLLSGVVLKRDQQYTSTSWNTQVCSGAVED